MADQAITALPKKTYSGSSQIASTDYLLGIDSAEGYQMLIQDLGEYIINRATASLAGSTQTLASAISALNSKSYNLTDISNTIPQNGNLNNYTTCGNYKLTYDSYASSISNCPVSVAFVLRVESTTGETNNYIKQVLIPRSSDQIWQRTLFESTWSSWLCIPTRSEFTTLSNAVNSKKNYKFGANVDLKSYTDADYTFPEDGYLCMALVANVNSYQDIVGILKGGSGSKNIFHSAMSTGGRGPIQYTYVRKDMRFRFISASNNCECYYLPFTS